MNFIYYKGRLLCTLTCILIYSFAKSQDLEKAWELLGKNQRNQAIELLQPKLKNNSATVDEYITAFLIKSFDGKDDEIKDFLAQMSKNGNDPYPYLYSLWFSKPAIGEYGTKSPNQLALLKYLISPKSTNGTLRASAHYHMGNHYALTHQFNLIKKEFEQIGAVLNWQFVGPFNNVSGSGFNKVYEPISDPSPNTTFLSERNAPIKWFSPVVQSYEGWIHTANYISENQGSLTYAQTFVNSPSDQEIYLCTGFSGNLKVWVNDKLVLSVSEELVTEMDAFNVKCSLKTGYNRILVQSGSDQQDPNFIIRLTNEKHEPIAGLTSTAELQQYTKLSGDTPNPLIPLEAETFFIAKIKAEPKNLVNYVLLSRVYLRNEKIFDARKTIEEALKQSPNNSILKMELATILIKEKNRTALSELYQFFKESESKSLVGYVIRIEELKDQEKYQEAYDLLKERMADYGTDASTYSEEIKLLAAIQDLPKLVSTIMEAYKKYPEEAVFVNYMFNIEKNVNKNPKKAVKLLDSYLSKHYEYSLTKLMIQEYFDQQNVKRPYQVMNEIIAAWPYDPSVRVNLMKEYMGQQKYAEAYEVVNFILKLKPYSGYYHEYKAVIEEAMGLTDKAIESYATAFKYQPTLYESRDKQRSLQKKPALLEQIEHPTIDELVANTGKNINKDDYDYYFLQDESNVILYPEGGREEIHITAIKVLNQRGIDKCSDFALPYNSSYESLVIEDAQLIKSNGKKTKPETSENQVVWTGLEVGDVIYVKYKIRSYRGGKFSREFYDKFPFDGFNPVELSRYVLIAPTSLNFNSEVLNGSVEPRITEMEGFKIYSWEKKNAVAIKEEPYMPAATDFVTTLHISTMKTWDEIAQWYSDIVYSKIANDNDYEVMNVYHQLFDGKTNLTSDDKARIIYDYIAKNIGYSSIPFRQGAIIPQRASTTINTRLGDCKDFSTLFVSLANLCGLKSNLVLVSTRDNGKKDMYLPSFLFNHCIVKYFDDKNVEHFLELTDRDMPFKSLPAGLYQAMSLTIPAKGSNESNNTLLPINTALKTTDKICTKSKIEIVGNDMQITTNSVRYGSLSNGYRSKYRDLSQEKVNKEMQETVSTQFSNPVTIKNVSFTALDQCADSIGVNMTYTVANEVKKIGTQSAFTIPFTDVVYTAAPFNLATRSQDFEYWEYESIDKYETQIEIVLPADKTFAEMPANQKLNFKSISYEINYSKVSPNKLLVTRKAQIDRNNVPAADYAKFKEFVTKIIDTEGAYITIK